MDISIFKFFFYIKFMTNIQDLIKNLDSCEYKKFMEAVEDRVYDRDWCKRHRINYNDPDILKLKKETYKELYLSK